MNKRDQSISLSSSKCFDAVAEDTPEFNTSQAELMKLGKIWHERLGHIGFQLLLKTAKITKGMPDLAGLREADFDCPVCTKAKMVRSPNKGPLEDPPSVLDSIEGDTFEIEPNAHNRLSTVLLLVDRKSRYRWAFLLPNKRGPNLFKTIKSFFKGLRNQYNRYPKRFFFDGGTEINNSLESWLVAKGIKFVTSSPYVHEQNGLIERSVRVLLERLRATILGADLPQYLWCYILPAVLDLVNNTAVTNKDVTPSQVFFDDLNPGNDNVPSIGHYRIIGAPCDALIPPEKRPKSRKLAAKTQPARLLAVLSLRTFLVWVPAKKQVMKTPFIKLQEGALINRRELTQSKDLFPREGEEVGLIHGSGMNLGMAVPEKPTKPQAKSGFHTQNPTDLACYSKLRCDNKLWPAEINHVDPIKCYPDSNLIDERASPGGTQPSGQTSVFDSYTNAETEVHELIQSLCYKILRRKVPRDGELSTLVQALKSPFHKEWLNAIASELTQLLEFGTFEFIPRNQLPKGRRPLTSRVVYRYKKNQRGEIQKFKTRLVVRGFMKILGVDYFNTFASTTIPPTWRILLAIAALLDWEIEQVDFVGAFLNSGLSENIYMEVPEELIKLATNSPSFMELAAKFGYNSRQNQVIFLRKALYGLKQSPRVWQQKLYNLLNGLGFTPLISDSAVYFNPKTLTFIITFVDDCLILGANTSYISDLKIKLGLKYAIEDRGPASFFLGVEILRDRPNRRLYITQRNYISEVLKHFDFEECHSIKIPLQPGLVKDVNEDVTALKGSPLSKSDVKLYQRILGCCMYAMTQTRPDIAFAMQYLSISLQSPPSCHLNAAFNLLRYLYGTRSYAICYGSSLARTLRQSLQQSKCNIDLDFDFDVKGTQLNDPLIPMGFSDSDFAGDKITSKSTYGYLFIVAGGPISWKSKRSSTIALSTMEAEADALTEAVREVQWLKNLHSELNRPLHNPILILEDNKAAIKAAKDPALHSRTKHTLLKYRYIREAIKAKVFNTFYIDTKSMPADGLTKPLAGDAHSGFIDLIGLAPIKINVGHS